MFPSKLGLFAIIISIFFCVPVEPKCSKGCDLALASYYVWPRSNLTFISEVMNDPLIDFLRYNPPIPHQDSVQADVRINVPFPCDCINGDFFAHVFKYRMRVDDTYEKVAGTYYANLTTTEWVQKFNSYDLNRISDGVQINVTVNCSCHDSSVSKDYGVFMTYPLRPGQTLDSVATETNLTTAVLKSYNPNANFSAGSGLVYIPTKVKQVALNGMKRKKIVAVTLAFSIGLLLLGMSLIVYLRKRKRKNSQLRREGFAGNLMHNSEQGHTDKSQMEDLELPLFDLAVIVNSTNNFSVNNKLGEGGFGPVYKGMLEGGLEIAVKFLSKNSQQGVDEFKNEVICIAKLQHRNLVKLLGYCVQGEERLLIYEYMANNSLDSFIFDQSKKMLLDWPKRFHIINGIARGLLYLHRDSRFRIIHRDLKASNILLDQEMNPKISDFGLARIFGGNETVANTKRVVGTFGYMSPEYAIEGRFSVKSDIFSFGVMVLEVVSGKRNRGICDPNHHLNLLGHAWKLYKAGKTTELIDASMQNSCNLPEVLRSIHVGLLCVQQRPEDRPNMASVVSMLGREGALTQPKQPGFFTEGNILEAGSERREIEKCSANMLTITLLEAR